MNIIEADTKFNLGSLDTVLGCNENRENNAFYECYKISHLVIGGSSAGKSTYVINQIIQGVYEFEQLFIFGPNESIEGTGVLARFIDVAQKSRKLKGKIHLNDLSKHKMPTFAQFTQFASQVKGKILILFDDFINTVNKEELNMIHRLLANCSRLSADIILIVQNLQKLPLWATQNCTIFTVWPRYLAKTQLKALLQNRTNLSLSTAQVDQLISYCRNHEDTRLPLTINNNAEIDKMIRFGNDFVTFDS